ncbi:MAG: glycosyltransferase [Endozoicomonas sp.]
MTKKIKILQLQTRYNVMSSDLAEQIIKALPSDQFEVTTAFLKEKPGANDKLSAAPKSVYFDFKSSELKGFRRWFAMRKIYRFCKEQQFDAVICHRFKPTHIMLSLNKKLNIPACISIAHGFGDYDRPYRQKLANQLMDEKWRFVGVSEPVRQYLVNTTKKMTDKSTVTINNAIDIEQATAIQLSREEAREKLELPKDRFIFGTIGRLVKIKGHSVMIDALALVRKEHPSAMVVIIGGGEEESNLKHQIKSLGLEDDVVLLGKKDEAIQYVKAFDVFVLPSFTEGLPLALLEGMSGSIPVIGSDIDTIRPYVEGLGQVCKVRDACSLAKAMEYYLSLSEEEVRQKGQEHFSTLCRRHSVDDFRNAYKNLLTSMLKN